MKYHSTTNKIIQYAFQYFFNPYGRINIQAGSANMRLQTLYTRDIVLFIVSEIQHKNGADEAFLYSMSGFHKFQVLEDLSLTS